MKKTDEEKKDQKDLVSKELNEKLSDITKSVVEKLSETDVQPKPKAKAKEEVKEEKAEVVVEKNISDDVVKQMTDVLSNLQKQVNALSEKLEKGIKSTEEVTKESIDKKKEDVQAGMVELVKSMGINPEDVDLNFVIKEKKKGVIETEDDDKFKEENTDVESEDFEKQFDKLPEEERQEALTMYFKRFLLS